MTLQLEIVTTHARLQELEPEWNALADRMANPLVRHEWMAHAVAAFGPDARLSVHIARDEGGMRAVAPLLVERSGGASRLRLLSWETYEPESFLFDDPSALAAVCGSVASTGMPVLLSRVGSTAPELQALQSAYRGRGKVVHRPTSTTSYGNPVPPDPASLEASMPKKKLNELRRRRKRLEAGGLSFEAEAPDASTFDEAFQRLLPVEATGWKKRKGTSLLQDHRARAFYEAYGRDIAARGMLRLFFLTHQGRPIAAQMHVLHADRLWALKIGYDEAFAKDSPGALLTHEVLRYAAGQGIRSFEHLGLAEDWQRRWPVEVREHSTLRLYPASLRGGAALAADAAGIATGKLRARLASRRPAPSAPAPAKAA